MKWNFSLLIIYTWFLFCYGMQLNLGKVQRPLVTRYVKLFYNVLKLLLVTVEQHEFKRVYKLDSFHLNLIPFKLKIPLLSFRAKCSWLCLDPMRSRPLFTSTGLSSPQQCNSWQFPQPTLSHYRPTSQRRGARSADNVESRLADNEVRVRKSAGASAERRDVSLCPTPHNSSC